MFTIVKYANVNVRLSHQDAWANFYSQVWRDEFGDRFGVFPITLREVLNQRLKEYGGRLNEDSQGRYIITFNQEQDYTWFELRWAGNNAISG